jgi:hypothetical protein
MRDYLVVTRGVNPLELERARMDYMTSGYDSGDTTPLEAVAYVSFQELATHGSQAHWQGHPRPDRRPVTCPALQGREHPLRRAALPRTARVAAQSDSDETPDIAS